MKPSAFLRNTFAAVLSIAALAAHADDRFKVSADGKEVTDTKTNLVWRRCVEGMAWDGKTCAGKAKKMTYANARKTAADAGSGWRLATKEEMLSLVDKSLKKKPLIDQTAFPKTPSGLSWANRPEMTDNLNGWMVDFRNGHVLGNAGSKAPVLRLVRAAG